MTGADPSTPEVPPPPPPVAVEATPIRFCRQCGAPWDAEWLECPHCARRAQARPAHESLARDQSAVKSAIALYFSLLAVSVVTMVYVLIDGEEHLATVELWAGGLMSAVTLGWCIGHWRSLVPLLGSTGGPLWLALAAGAAVPTFLIATGAIRVLAWFDVPILNYCEPFYREGYGWGWIILSVCIQPAIIEELAFRGVIQTSLKGVLGNTESILVTAMVFAILHLSALSLPHLLVLGLALGALRAHTGSLYPGMAMHFAHNFLVIAGERWGGLLPC